MHHIQSRNPTPPERLDFYSGVVRNERCQTGVGLFIAPYLSKTLTSLRFMVKRISLILLFHFTGPNNSTGDPAFLKALRGVLEGGNAIVLSENLNTHVGSDNITWSDWAQPDRSESKQCLLTGLLCYYTLSMTRCPLIHCNAVPLPL